MVSHSTTTDRRQFLRSAAGASLALPVLESFAGTATAPPAPAQRLVCIGSYLGYHQASFFPKTAGRDYETSDLLTPIQAHRDDFTVFSGLDHRAGNGHGNWPNFLSGKTSGSYSLDQIVADQLGEQTRFASIQLTAGKASRSMSFTKSGVALPMIDRPSVLFDRLFASPEDRARRAYLLESGGSSIDRVLAEVNALRKTVSARDRAKLDEYLESVRSVEKTMQKQIAGIDDPIPTTDYQLPDYDPVAPTLMLEAEKLMYDLMALALETDSSRVLSLFLPGLGQVFTIEGQTLQAGYHALSHHGNDPDKITDLLKVEREHMKCLARFLDQLKTKTDGNGEPLLDSTIVLFGTGMGDASRHANNNLPTLVAGGGFDHGRHIAVDPAGKETPPRLLGDLYLTLMQQLGLEEDRFSNADRNMNDLFA